MPSTKRKLSPMEIAQAQPCRQARGLGGCWGIGVLRDYEIDVLEVNRLDRANRRLQGKSDPTDAESAARTVLSGTAAAIPKAQSIAAEAMRAVSIARRSAVKAKTQAINQIRALLVCAPQHVRERLWKGKPSECIDGCAHLRSFGDNAALAKPWRRHCECWPTSG